jgi:hypothetical protein
MGFDFSIIERLYNFHMKGGYNLPCCDIDHLVVEYNHEIPRAVIEYKTKEANFNLDSPNVKAVSWLANAAKIPFYIVRYSDHSFDYFNLLQINEAAKRQLANSIELYDSKRFFDFLTWIRAN